jgi:hypothetical protein
MLDTVPFNFVPGSMILCYQPPIGDDSFSYAPTRIRAKEPLSLGKPSITGWFLQATLPAGIALNLSGSALQALAC